MRAAWILAVCAALLLPVGCAPSRTQTSKPSVVPRRSAESLLAAARSDIPAWYAAHDTSSTDLGNVNPATLVVRIADTADSSLPRSVSSDRPVFAQLRPLPKPWDRTLAVLDVVAPPGTVIAQMYYRWGGTGWERDDRYWPDRSILADMARQRARAVAALETQLGGSLDEITVTDGWVLARRGKREAGVAQLPPGLSHGPFPLGGRVYEGSDLWAWLNGYPQR